MHSEPWKCTKRCYLQKNNKKKQYFHAKGAAPLLHRLRLHPPRATQSNFAPKVLFFFVFLVNSSVSTTYTTPAPPRAPFRQSEAGGGGTGAWGVHKTLLFTKETKKNNTFKAKQLTGKRQSEAGGGGMGAWGVHQTLLFTRKTKKTRLSRERGRATPPRPPPTPSPKATQGKFPSKTLFFLFFL